MPFVSEKQRRFLWAQKPDIARKFVKHSKHNMNKKKRVTESILFARSLISAVDLHPLCEAAVSDDKTLGEISKTSMTNAADLPQEGIKGQYLDERLDKPLLDVDLNKIPIYLWPLVLAHVYMSGIMGVKTSDNNGNLRDVVLDDVIEHILSPAHYPVFSVSEHLLNPGPHEKILIDGMWVTPNRVIILKHKDDVTKFIELLRKQITDIGNTEEDVNESS